MLPICWNPPLPRICILVWFRLVGKMEPILYCHWLQYHYPCHTGFLTLFFNHFPFSDSVHFPLEVNWKIRGGEGILPPHPDPWKNCLAWNWPLVSKSWGLALPPLSCGQWETPRNYIPGLNARTSGTSKEKVRQNLGAFKAMLPLNSVLLKLKR